MPWASALCTSLGVVMYFLASSLTFGVRLLSSSLSSAIPLAAPIAVLAAVAAAFPGIKFVAS